MADNVAVTAGSGTTIAADEVTDGTLGTVKVQYVKIMDGALDGTTKASVGANGLAVAVASGGIASGAVASGAVASGAFASGSIASGAIASGAIASGAIAAGAIAAGATSIAENEDVASADGDRGVKILFKRLDTPANSSGTDGDYEQPQMSAGRVWATANIDKMNGVAVSMGSGANGTGVQRVTIATDQTWPTGMSPKGFSAAFSTLTRPANTTAYAALDSISNNATAGSVTALSATVSDTNDDPITVTEILIDSTDTGLAGKRIRAYLYNSDPTASSGVGGGDNAAFANKKAGYVGSFSGVLETGFSDGTVGRLVPTYADGVAAASQHAPAGGFIVTKPSSGAKLLYVQYQAVDAFTPSANSTTIIGTIRGYQGRAS